MKRFCLMAMLSLIAAAAYAQPMTDMPEHREGPGRPGMPPMMDGEWAAVDSSDTTFQPGHMGKERRMLEAVRISRMTEALDLSEEQIARFFPRLRKMEEAMRALDKQHDQMVDDLEKLLAGKVADADLKAKLEQINKLDDQKYQRRQADRGDLDAILSVRQRAQLRVFNQKFEDEIRSMVRTIRERRMRHTRP